MKRTILIQNQEDYPEGLWVTIAHENDEGKVNDEEIYFYVPNNMNLLTLKKGQIINLDTKFKILDLEPITIKIKKPKPKTKKIIKRRRDGVIQRYNTKPKIRLITAYINKKNKKILHQHELRNMHVFDQIKIIEELAKKHKIQPKDIITTILKQEKCTYCKEKAYTKYDNKNVCNKHYNIEMNKAFKKLIKKNK